MQFAGWLCRFAAFWCLLEAFNVGGSVSNVLLVLGVNAVAALVPFTPGGAGVQQALLVKVFGSGATVAAYSVGQQIAIAALTFLIGLFALTGSSASSPSRRSSRRARRSGRRRRPRKSPRDPARRGAAVRRRGAARLPGPADGAGRGGVRRTASTAAACRTARSSSCVAHPQRDGGVSHDVTGLLDLDAPVGEIADAPRRARTSPGLRVPGCVDGGRDRRPGRARPADHGAGRPHARRAARRRRPARRWRRPRGTITHCFPTLEAIAARTRQRVRHAATPAATRCARSPASRSTA